MTKISTEDLAKMQGFIEARNNATRRNIVELVSQYVLSDLPEGEEKSDSLVRSRYHLSTDQGKEDLRDLYLDALAWLEEVDSGMVDEEVIPNE